MAHPDLSRRAAHGGSRLVVALVVAVVAIQALMLFAFAWPATRTGPREVPIALAGPPPAVGAIERGLSTAPGPDDGIPAFRVIRVADEAAAVNAIRDREAYGAVVVSPAGPRLLVASAAGPAVAQLLRSAAGRLAPGGASVPVQDVVPLPANDPTGAGLAAGMLPLVITSAVGGLFAAMLLQRRSHRLTMVVGLAALAGLAAAALLQYGLEVTEGSYWALTGVAALLVGATAAAVAGLGAVLGRAGAALGLLVMVFLGNPLSAAATAPQMLPRPWGDLGQLMPPGAGVTAVRSVAFFDGAALGTPALVLSIWLLVGLALVALGKARQPTERRGAGGSVPARLGAAG
jgi:hypothetical protein